MCFLKKGRHQDCIKSCKNALAFKANNPKTHYRLALAYKAENDFDRSQDSFKAAIKLAPSD